MRFDYPTKTVYLPKCHLYLGTKLNPAEFTVKCFSRGDDNWRFVYPSDRLLSLVGTITDELMRNPDMWDGDGEPCLLVVKGGNVTETIIGRANGVFSIFCDYFNDMSVNQTSMEWGIINYDSKSEVFSKPGDSGSAIADIRGRIGGMLAGGSGKTKPSDMTCATPFWWLLERIKANGFQCAPQRRRLGISTSTMTSKPVFVCDFFSFFYVPLSTGWLLCRRVLGPVDRWLGSCLFSVSSFRPYN